MAKRARNKAANAAKRERFAPAQAKPREIVLDGVRMKTNLPEIFPILPDEFPLLEAYFTDLIDQALRPTE